MADEVANGRLSEAQNEHIFRTEILPDHLPDDIQAADRPVLIVLGGQPGSGVTALLTASHTELEQTCPAIRIVGDDLRSYHPGFVAHQNADPMTASRFTQGDAGIWSEKLLAAAAKRGVHVMFETTMRAPDKVEKIMTAGRSAGYRIEARVLAVSPRVSWQGCHYRFEELHHAGAAARIPPRAVHDAAVAGLTESLERIERRKLADRVVIQSADGEAVYDNQLANGRWRSATTASQVLDETRSRPLSREEIDGFALVWARVVARMEARSAPAALIDEVKALSRDDLAWFLAERRRSGEDDAMKTAREIKQRIGTDPSPIIPSDGEDSLARSRVRISKEDKPDRHVRPGGVLIPGRDLPDLTEAEIGIKLRQSSRLEQKRSEIERLSQLVYGNAAATSAVVDGIDGATTGSVAGQDIRTGGLGPIAGAGRGFLRTESPERQTAKAHLPQLAAAMEDYGRTVDFERHQIETRHREEQHRQRHEIRAPSKGLTGILQAPAREQASRLHAAPQLRRELDGIAMSINRRLTPTDRNALKSGDLDQLSRNLAVSPDRVATLARVQSQMQAVHGQTQLQLERGRNAAISIKR
ncbi:zeta toxin family protein [Pseudaminobacter sp. 19-2017]|uniref:Zeta toxin family protein n=1 Tax=Pseudaminobacter soli (ex Zhang et al. 2022) TaxID=2831468 RepID=A0A942E6N6_9HYPH|nr:zeta toxin family protein [Pseudaminobacter soli]MBS3651896.1 zeta toxin family protein [Pseudaminobacter soli]